MIEQDYKLDSTFGWTYEDKPAGSCECVATMDASYGETPDDSKIIGDEGIGNPSGRKNYTSNAPIGVFDSGAGGLTVVRQIRRLLPNESVLYFGDTGRVPYGPRPQSQVREFSVQIAEFLRTKGAKAIIIACNTATAAGLEAVQKSFPGPVIGVIRPGAESAYAQAGACGRIGLIATQGTVTSGVYDKELASLGYALPLIKQACPDFVTLVEAGMQDQSAIEDAVKRYMGLFHESQVDVLILGCTHFPLLAEEIKKELPGAVLIDPAIQTVMVMKGILKENGILAAPDMKPVYRFFCSGDPDSFSRSLNLILGSNDYSVDHVTL